MTRSADEPALLASYARHVGRVGESLGVPRELLFGEPIVLPEGDADPAQMLTLRELEILVARASRLTGEVDLAKLAEDLA